MERSSRTPPARESRDAVPAVLGALGETEAICRAVRVEAENQALV